MPALRAGNKLCEFTLQFTGIRKSTKAFDVYTFFEKEIAAAVKVCLDLATHRNDFYFEVRATSLNPRVHSFLFCLSKEPVL